MVSSRFALVALLLAPAPLRAEMRWSKGVSVGLTAAPLYTLTGLQAATDKFLDVPLRQAARGAGSGRALSAFRVQPGPQLGLWLKVETDLSPRLRLAAGGAYVVALTSVRFPDGIDVFTDPARARLLGQALRGDLALEWGRDWQVSVGLGLELAMVQTHVTSALLDVTAVSHMAQGYVRLGLARDLPDGLRFAADLRFNKKDADLSIGILSRF